MKLILTLTFFFFFNNSKALTIDVKRVGENATKHLPLISQAVDGRHQGTGPTRVAINDVLIG